MRATINLIRGLLASGVGVLAFAALTAGANAQITSAQQSAVRANCRSDFMSKCSGVTPGGKEALECLQKNVVNLSPGCQKAVRATIPAPPAPAPKAEPAAPAPVVHPAEAPAPPAATAAPAPVVSAPPPHAKVAKPVKKKPAPAVVAAPTSIVPPPPAAAPAPLHKPVAPVVSGIVLGRACLRDVLLHCRGFGLNEAKKIACLTAYHNSGHRLAPLCQTALKLTPMH